MTQRQIAILTYSDTALPTDSNTVVLWSSGAYAAAAKYMTQGAGVLRYTLRLRNSHTGTIKFEKSTDNVTFTVVHQQTVAASASNDVNRVSCAMHNYPYFRVRWTNGGTTQTTFDPMQSLVDDDTTGQQTEQAARVRGWVTDDTNNFAYKAQTTHTVFAIPSAWLGRRVSISVVAAALLGTGLTPTVWFAFGTSSGMEVDRSVFVTGTPPAFTGNAKFGRPIGHGENVDYYVDPSWTHFAVETDLNDTAIYIGLSDFAPQIID